MGGWNLRIRNDRCVKAVCCVSWSLVWLVAGCSPAARTVNLAPPGEAQVEPLESLATLGTGGPGADGIPLTPEALMSDALRADWEAALELLDAEQYEPGIALLVKVTEGAGEVAAAHIDLGMAYARAGSPEDAEVALRRALALKPEHPVAHNEFGLLERRRGEFELARGSYEAALAHSPEFRYAHRNLAILCDLYLGDYACALEHYEAYSRLAPEDEDIARWVTDLRRRRNQQENP
jgi:Flp pilus assembly protein TadD